MSQLLARSTPATRLGLGMASMAMVLLELLLTRIFSASAGYHFAFMITSMTMFGLTAGALYSFAKPPKSDAELQKMLITSTAIFAGSIPIAFVLHNFINDAMTSIGVMWWIAATFITYSIVFFFAGAAISLCLTRFQEIGKLYCADLIGASIGCPLLIFGLTHTDPQVIVAASGIFAGLAAFCFSRAQASSETRSSYIKAGSAILISIVLLFLPPHRPMLTSVDQPIELTKWSPCGRVIATTNNAPVATWARVANPPSKMVAQKGLFIDFGAFTVMTNGAASTEDLDPIKHDMTAVGNRLRPASSLFVIGVGGGRDVLTGLLFGQKRIDGIEVNPAIVEMVKQRFADFNGHLAEKPGVRIINDEARNWLARSNSKYKIIQCSLVDTWAAASSGAFMLTENSLYTKEAFELYIRHLEPDGLLSFLRWGDEKESAQLLRMLALAKNALTSIGIKDQGQHIMLVYGPHRSSDVNMGNLLVSPTPFSQKDIDNLLAISKEEHYTPLWIPGVAAVEPYASAIKNETELAGMPTDNKPFFFTPVKPSANESTLAEPEAGKGLSLLMFTLVEAALLVLWVILVPSIKLMRGKIGSSDQILKSGWMFSCLGIAFMLVEVGQVQRLTILLGNPTYGLSVVLFGLLLFAGIGSFTSELVLEKSKNARTLLAVSLVTSALLVGITAMLFAGWLPSLESAQLTERIIAAMALVSIPGFFMGWGFPLSLTYFTKNAPDAGAWFWALNGATSVLSSVLASIISIIWGIETTLLCGAACYLLALLSLL